jgi:uroporphyrinogen decarboxylase
MDPVELKRKYGDRLTFHGGGVDVQTTMAHGTVEDVRAEVSERLRVLGDGGGYILAPSHSVQVESGVEKTLAIYEVGQGRTL